MLGCIGYVLTFMVIISALATGQLLTAMVFVGIVWTIIKVIREMDNIILVEEEDEYFVEYSIKNKRRK